MKLPTNYKPKLNLIETQKGIKLVKDTFEKQLAEKLNLLRVTAPRFLKTGTGLQDDLAGTQRPVRFLNPSIKKPIEVVQSLAKWKRYALGKYGFKIGEGLYTDMDAIRKDEPVDEIHSIYCDQWDWELVISKKQRNSDFLRKVVWKIYNALLETEAVVKKEFPVLRTNLPKGIVFFPAEERGEEEELAKACEAVFLEGIGYPLKSGQPYEPRASDYDDWKLNGDLIVWHEERKKALELSSMGIRVDADSLLEQLRIMKEEKKMELEFHKAILEDKLPLTIGGGIGQSRLCMMLLQKAHIGEVQSSVWPEEVEKEFKKKGIILL